MDQYTAKLERINKQAEKLVNEYNKLKTGYAALQQENEELRQSLRSGAEKVDGLEHNLRVVKVAKQLAAFPDDEKAELKKKINEFIKEIDKCVALLND